MMMKWRLFLILTIAGLMTACAGTTPSSNEYLLIDADIMKVETRSIEATFVQIMPVSVANYLAGNEIVLVTEQGQVHRSANNLWAEALSSQLTRLTQQRLEKSLPNVTWFGTQRLPAEAIALLNIEVDDFYADLKGMVHISGRWQLMSSSSVLSASKTFYVTENLKSDGYASMVQTLSESWFNDVIDPMVNDIVQSLNQ